MKLAEWFKEVIAYFERHNCKVVSVNCGLSSSYFKFNPSDLMYDYSVNVVVDLCRVVSVPVEESVFRDHNIGGVDLHLSCVSEIDGEPHEAEFNCLMTHL